MNKQTILRIQNQIESLTARYTSKHITINTWATEFADLLSELTIAQVQQVRRSKILPDSDLALIKNYLEEVISNARVTQRDVDSRGKINRTKHEFGIKKLTREISKGDVSPEQLMERVRLYGQHTRTVAEEVKKEINKEQGKTEVLNVLQKTSKGKGTNHAPICIEATSRGWMNVDEMEKTVGLAPRHANCICLLVYR